MIDLNFTDAIHQLTDLEEILDSKHFRKPVRVFVLNLYFTLSKQIKKHIFFDELGLLSWEFLKYLFYINFIALC